MNDDKNIEVLQDVTAKLIDSCEGYQMCADIVEDNQTLKSEFLQRKNSRNLLVKDFNAKIASLGGEVKDSGSAAGALHRGYTKFINVFKDDEEAAVDALDDGEEYLAEFIEKKRKQDGLTPETILLLNKAHASALEGERFADFLDD
ncbi:PA2169 family four-helix-bundle protein [Marinicella gelatinilytica]|uniref:PA2169 family four-helix-bundle protein n=1 Tax=Marinicella gelatinilytica TaxID=2996017 RepID=UPI002260B051|nr:PA2169 family four-helix-bundle protein [Marinicella gelatinilytica]MCX7544704.1 PA2169 family four-helix-bundle protein [Marinicella gelatinilytica]